ncbi:Lrp/AsnC family transcriptional regulator [Kribbella sp. NPDC048928]|uniref:Lrp/AsnC family transcriptional regulator n=1 Tax=Kribbella sp. NPDC048928 TaxID=3364111 RepID=UPI003714F98A
MTGDPFDELDRGLLHARHLDARAPFRRLGEVLGVSDQTVARRYARLRESGALRVTALSHPGLLRRRRLPVRQTRPSNFRPDCHPPQPVP